MERKVGEVFTYKGKTYQVVKSNMCMDCAFKGRMCSLFKLYTGPCTSSIRFDKTSVIFKKIKGMEIKDNKLTINIPEGMEIDLENSNFNTGVICFKKKQPEFKDGDILYVKTKKLGSEYIIINKLSEEAKTAFYVAYNLSSKKIFWNLTYFICYDKEISILRQATDYEKSQLFDALAKEGKAWNSEKKAIVDFKPKFEFKPFDKVLSRRCSEDYWVLNFYSHKTDYYHICIDGSSNLYCIPYNKETAHLLGTTDDLEECNHD